MRFQVIGGGVSMQANVLSDLGNNIDVRLREEGEQLNRGMSLLVQMQAAQTTLACQTP